MRSYYSLLTICLCTAIAMLHIGACNSPSNSKPNDNLAIKIDTVTDAPSEVYDIADYDTIHINGYTLYFEPYDSVAFEIPFFDTFNLYGNNLKETKIKRNLMEQLGSTYEENFHRKGDTLFLHLANAGITRVTDNNSEDTNRSLYYYAQSIPGYHIVKAYFYEGSATLTVNKESGYQICTSGSPCFTVDSAYFATFNGVPECGYEPNEICFYNVTSNDSIACLFKLPINNWMPTNFAWINDNEAVVQKKLDYNHPSNANYAYTKMTITKP